ncbi:hypothetical protein EU803_15825 [Loktanella sp. IMCC34160]|uniref:hypothetical protein n=1 Tax=Loktanella sp. IMCC34160 TaxID=2510646 RepID=UPI00101C6E38|nr:hypothetical protein [Loktanella sp. IMCC34160]RYG90079.1 hypothetical protein EU803_15825 [Loktanella sp. IMCC34160]
MPGFDREIEAILTVLRKHYGVIESQLSLDLSINLDVGIDGDDAGEFLELLSTEIGRDFEFDFAQYFCGEGLFHLRRRKILTVSTLAELLRSTAIR